MSVFCAVFAHWPERTFATLKGDRTPPLCSVHASAPCDHHRPAKSCFNRSLKLQMVWSVFGSRGFVWLIMQPVSDTIYTISWLANHYHPSRPQSPSALLSCSIRWSYHVLNKTHAEYIMCTHANGLQQILTLNATSENQYFCSGKRRRLQYQFFSLVYLNNKIIKYFCISVCGQESGLCTPRRASPGEHIQGCRLQLVHDKLIFQFQSHARASWLRKFPIE